MFAKNLIKLMTEHPGIMFSFAFDEDEEFFTIRVRKGRFERKVVMPKGQLFDSAYEPDEFLCIVVESTINNFERSLMRMEGEAIGIVEQLFYDEEEKQ